MGFVTILSNYIKRWRNIVGSDNTLQVTRRRVFRQRRLDRDVLAMLLFHIMCDRPNQ